MRVRRTAAQIVSCFQLVRAQVHWHICTHLHSYSLFQNRDKKGFQSHIHFATCAHLPPSGLRITSWITRGLRGLRSVIPAHEKRKAPVSSASVRFIRYCVPKGNNMGRVSSCVRCQLFTRSGPCCEIPLKVTSMREDLLFSFANRCSVPVCPPS